MISAFGVDHSLIAKTDDKQARYYRRQANTLGAVSVGSAGLAGIAGGIGLREHHGHDPMGFAQPHNWRTTVPKRERALELSRVAHEHGKQVLEAGAASLATGGLAAAYRRKQRKAQLTKADRRDRNLDIATMGAGTAAVGGSLYGARGYNEHADKAGKRALSAHRLLRGDTGGHHVRELEHAWHNRRTGARVWALKKPGSAAVVGMGALGGAAAIGAGRHLYQGRQQS